jgi:hypothetical protein
MLRRGTASDVAWVHFREQTWVYSRERRRHTAPNLDDHAPYPEHRALDMAHCRRKFFEAAICKYPVGIQGLMRIRAIYAADEAFRRMPPAKRKLMRAEHLRPLLESFFEWVKHARLVTDGRNLATSALGYAFNQENELLPRRWSTTPRQHTPGAFAPQNRPPA